MGSCGLDSSDADQGFLNMVMKFKLHKRQVR